MTARKASKPNLITRALRAIRAGLIWMSQPAASLASPEKRRRGQILAAYFIFIFFSILLGFIAVYRTGDPTWIPMAGASFLLLVGYLAIRLGHYHTALVLALVAPIIPAPAQIILSQQMTNVEASLMWVALPLLISPFLLNLRQSVFVALAYFTAAALLITVPGVSFINLAEVLAFIVTITFFTIVISAARRNDQKEIETQLQELKEKDAALADEAVRRRILIEQSSDGIVVLDQDGRVYEANQRFADMLGYSLEEARQLSVWDWEFLYPREQVVEMIRTVDESGDHFETKHRRKDGSIYDVEISTNGAEFAGQKLIFCVCRDITERKKADEALKESEDKFSKAFRSSPNAMCISTLEGGVLLEVNDSFTRDTGWTRQEAIGHSSLELGLWADSEERERILGKIRQDSRVMNEEYRCHIKSGEIRTQLFSAEPISFAGKDCILAVTVDITERKRAEEELRKSGAHLEAANKELEAFSYSVSHDLRSPLRSIDGFSQALLEDYPDKLDETGRDYLNRLRHASQKMGELIDGILKLSRLTRGELHQETVNLSGLALEITERLHEEQSKREVEFVIAKGLTAHGDTQMLRALLENLLGNAWKFTGKTDHPRIEFGQNRDGDRPVFFVRDNGAGFDPAYTDKLFNAFQRLHSETEFPGTGIGLATVQRIVNRHGGTIRAEGEVNKGATFYFTLN